MTTRNSDSGHTRGNKWLFCPLEMRRSEESRVVSSALMIVRCLYLQAGLLWCQVGASSHSSQLYGGHGAADVQVFARWPRSLHLRDAVGAAHRLGRVLTQDGKCQNGVNYSGGADEGIASAAAWLLPARRRCRWLLRCWRRGRWSPRCCQPWPSPPGSCWCSVPLVLPCCSSIPARDEDRVVWLEGWQDAKKIRKTDASLSVQVFKSCVCHMKCCVAKSGGIVHARNKVKL